MTAICTNKMDRPTIYLPVRFDSQPNSVEQAEQAALRRPRRPLARPSLGHLLEEHGTR